MAINETGAIYKSLTYGGKTSREYGVYITGEGVYNAPERDVEMIDIPGRNGAYALDHGRFSNIEIEYPCSIAADNETDYREALSVFRNWLCSQKGYVRLTDDYNPDEYRLAVYKSGLEVSTVQQTAGEFTITFEAKPQRFLTSGETAITVQSGDTVNNPTLFDSSPLIEIDGYGTLNIGDVSVTIDNTLVGDYIALDFKEVSDNEYTINFADVPMLTGDTITVKGILYNFTIYNNDITATFTSQTITNVTGSPTYQPTATGDGSRVIVNAQLDSDPTTYTYGTPASKTISFNANVTNSNSDSMTIKVYVTLEYDGAKKIKVSARMRIPSQNAYKIYAPVFTLGTGVDAAAVVHSTASTYGNPTYIDTDVGEVYAYLDGVINSLNRYIQLPAKLPTLAPGNTTITYDNTITQLKVAPRYWII